jgi:hypothetical protein
MKRAIGKPTKAQQAYQDAARELGCVVCRYRIERGMQHALGCGPTHIHHRNLGDLHGQKQLGHDSIVAMGAWHHDGDQLSGKSRDEMRAMFGPSFKNNAKDFRAWTADMLPGYPRGTEGWQRWQDEMLNLRGKAA